MILCLLLKHLVLLSINDDSSYQMLQGDQSEKFLHAHLYQEA